MYWVCIDFLAYVALFGGCVMWVIGWLLLLYGVVRLG